MISNLVTLRLVVIIHTQKYPWIWPYEKDIANASMKSTYILIKYFIMLINLSRIHAYIISVHITVEECILGIVNQLFV